jgi:hypothetical protein
LGDSSVGGGIAVSDAGFGSGAEFTKPQRFSLKMLRRAD